MAMKAFFVDVDPGNPQSHHVKKHENDSGDAPEANVQLNGLNPIGVIYSTRANPITLQCYSVSDSSPEALDPAVQDCLVLYIGGSVYLFC